MAEIQDEIVQRLLEHNLVDRIELEQGGLLTLPDAPPQDTLVCADASFVDDLLVMGSDSCDNIVLKAANICSVVVETCESRGFVLNFKIGKSMLEIPFCGQGLSSSKASSVERLQRLCSIPGSWAESHDCCHPSVCASWHDFLRSDYYGA